MLSLFVLSNLFSANGYAQNINVAVGYTSMPGQIGHFPSDHGPSLRLGVDILDRRHFAWNVEGGVDRLNEHRTQYTDTCYLLDGSIGPCHFDNSGQDTAWSLGTVVRVAPFSFQVNPYALVGAGYLTVSNHYQALGVDDAGNELTNFTADVRWSDGALQAHLGAGVGSRLGDLPVSLYAEGRATRLFYTYSGGFNSSWSPSIVVGVRHRLGGSEAL